MSFTKSKKEKIKKHILYLISNKDDDISKKTMEVFDVSATTVSRYIKEMMNEKVIEKAKKNRNKCKYNLVIEKTGFIYKLKAKKLEEDILYSENIYPLIKDLPKNVVDIWIYVFTEIMNNAIEHSNCETIGCTVSRDYLKTSIFIADDGIGIFKKIQKYSEEVLGKIITVDDAINELFTGKLTTDSEHHSGEGIFFSSRAVDLFFIYSSDKLFIHNCYEDDIIDDIRETKIVNKSLLESMNGTIVKMTLSNESKRTLTEVFDMFADTEKGFYKTQIPMKNMIINGSLVSRSQARRINSRFDQFEEVELDFSEVEDIGQAFAHEMFVVFAKNNEKVKLIPINANDKVNNMIKRVINTNRN